MEEYNTLTLFQECLSKVPENISKEVDEFFNKMNNIGA